MNESKSFFRKVWGRPHLLRFKTFLLIKLDLFKNFSVDRKNILNIQKKLLRSGHYKLL